MDDPSSPASLSSVTSHFGTPPVSVPDGSFSCFWQMCPSEAASGRATQVKHPAANPQDLRTIPMSYTVQGEKQFQQCPLTFKDMLRHKRASKYRNLKKQNP